MLSPLLALLLSAAPDSTSPTDPLSERAADSVALERISPLPAPSPSFPSAPPVRRLHQESPLLQDSLGPLTQGALGIGFRVLGEAPRLHLQIALSPTTYLRLRGSLLARSENEARDLQQTPLPTNGFNPAGRSKSIDVEQNFTSWQVQLALGGLGLCQGSLCGTWSVGPFLGREITTIENAEILSTLDYEYRERSLLKRLGVAGSSGLHWEFRRGLALSADVGASWASLSGSRTQATLSNFSKETTSTKGDRKGSEFLVEFLGVGLDAWF